MSSLRQNDSSRVSKVVTTKEPPLVSIVTPVYNGERYLRACIESVLAQTHTQWDYTIVNNCSTDGTLEIAREYTERDSRIRIYNNQTFVRVIENYNIALRQISAESKYCKVIAADDLLFPECVEKMVSLVEDNPKVGIVGAYGLRGTSVMWRGLPYNHKVVPGREACRNWLLGGPYIFGTPTSVLVRSDIVCSRSVFYNESNLHSDSEACLEILEHYDYGFVHQILTIQGVREDSLTSVSESLQTYLPWILYELLQYGPKYLKEDELKHRIRQHLTSYYRYLGKQVYQKRDREFWNFHKGKLIACGRPLSRIRVLASAILYALDLVLNPKSTVEELVHRLAGG